MHSTYEWIIECIKSCTNDFQLICCSKLMGLFLERYENEQEAGILHSMLIDVYEAKETMMSVTA